MKRILLLVFVFITGCSAKVPLVDEKNIITVSRGDKTYWSRTKAQIPIYPYKALRERVDGCVNVSYIINVSGRVESLKVIGSFPKSVFDRPAIQAVKEYRYHAADQNVNKIPVRTSEIVTFLLDYPDYSSPSKKNIERKCEVISEK